MNKYVLTILFLSVLMFPMISAENVTINITIEDAPLINLTLPADNNITTIDQASVLFQGTSDSNTSFWDGDLYVWYTNNSRISLNSTNQSVFNNTAPYSANVSMVPGIYTWNIESCYSGVCIMSPSNYTFTIPTAASISANSTTASVGAGDDFEVNVTAEGTGTLWSWTQKYINGVVEGTISAVEVVSGVMTNVATFLWGTFNSEDNLTAEVFISSDYGNSTPVNFSITVDTYGPQIEFISPTLDNNTVSGTENISISFNETSGQNISSGGNLSIFNSSGLVVEMPYPGSTPANYSYYLPNGNYTFYVQATNIEGITNYTENRSVEVRHPEVTINVTGTLRYWDYPTVRSPFRPSANVSCSAETFGTTLIENATIRVSYPGLYPGTFFPREWAYIDNTTQVNNLTVFGGGDGKGSTPGNGDDIYMDIFPITGYNATIDCILTSTDGENITSSTFIFEYDEEPPVINYITVQNFSYDYLKEGQDANVTFNATDNIGLHTDWRTGFGCQIQYGRTYDSVYDALNLDNIYFPHDQTVGNEGCIDGQEYIKTIPFNSSAAYINGWARDSYRLTTVTNYTTQFAFSGVVSNETYDTTVSDTEVSDYQIVFNPTPFGLTAETVTGVTLNAYIGNIAATLVSQVGDIYTYSAEQNQQDGFDGNRTFYWTVTTNVGTHTTEVRDQVVEDVNLYRCNNESNVSYIAFKTYDEETLLPIAAAVDDAQLLFSEGSPTYKLFEDVNGTEIVDAYYCYDDPTETINVEAIFKYSATGYPLRTHSNDYTGLTNNTTIANIYLLSEDDGRYVTVGVTDVNNNPQGAAHITWTRNIAGSPNIIGQDDTDDTGAATFWLNPDFPHTLTVEKTGCDTSISTITPALASYGVSLECDDDSYTYASLTEGVTWEKRPKVGLLEAEDNVLFEYRLRSKVHNMTGGKFTIVEFANRSVVIGENISYVDGSTGGAGFGSGNQGCTATHCYTSLTLNFSAEDSWIGQYYVRMEGDDRWILLESDGQWSEINVTVGSSSLWSFFSNLPDYWAATVDVDGQTIEQKKIEYSRILIVFFTLALFLALFGRTTGYDAVNPGSFAVLLTLALWGMSLAGFLTIDNVSFSSTNPVMAIIDQFAIAFVASMYTGAIWLSTLRRQTQ